MNLIFYSQRYLLAFSFEKYYLIDVQHFLFFHHKTVFAYAYLSSILTITAISAYAHPQRPGTHS